MLSTERLTVLRDYQKKAISDIRDHYRVGIKKVLLHLSTGAGKTVVFAEVLKEASLKGTRCIVVTRGRKLIDQASQRLFREGVHHGVLMARHWNYRPAALVQVCSVDTLIARNLTPEAKLIVIDEAHQSTSTGYFKFIEKYPNAYILAVTATPYGDKSLRHVAESIIKPIGMTELIEQGHLVDARYFAPSAPDLAGVKISSSTHDYAQDELALAMQKGSLVGDLVDHWVKLSEGRATLVFAVSIRHSKNIVQQFMNAGISAEHCDADTPEAEREAIIERHKAGITKIISNVGIFCTGIDLPYLGCIALCRPTCSYSLYIQQCGRGTRPFKDKSDFIILDHAGNVPKHGFITDEPEANLDGRKITGAKKPKTCSQCYAVFYTLKCPACGYTKPDSERETKEVITKEGQLQEVTDSLEAKVKRDIERFEATRKIQKFKKGWVFFRIVEKYGQEIANQFIPQRDVPFWVNRGTHSASERNPRIPLTDNELSRVEITKGSDEN